MFLDRFSVSRFTHTSANIKQQHITLSVRFWRFLCSEIIYFQGATTVTDILQKLQTCPQASTHSTVNTHVYIYTQPRSYAYITCKMNPSRNSSELKTMFQPESMITLQPNLPIIRDSSVISLSLRFRRLRDSSLYRASGTLGRALSERSTSVNKSK